MVYLISCPKGKTMKVYLLKDVEKVGIAGEIIKVSDGFARNNLLPRKLGIEVTDNNESYFKQREKVIEKRHEVIATKTSMLAERIKSIKLVLKRKLHDDGKLYGSVNPTEVVQLLSNNGISVSKNQIEFDKSIKEKGSYEVTVKLSSRLQPKLILQVISE
jgi:large subunit ribosomal protein L9